VNWSQFILGHTYAAIVTQNDLGGVGITSAQQALVSGSAVSSCDLVNGQHIGRILDPTTCKYDPTKDASALCSGVTIGSITGTNTTAACLSAPQAHAVNKIWYGMTTDGSYVDPAIDNGQQVQLTGNHLAYGAVRGANVSLQGLIPAISIGLHMIPLILQNPWYGSTDFTNATGNGMEGWRTLGYLQFANVLDQAYLLQPYFGNIDTTKTNLTEAKNSGAKILHYHGLADQAIMPANSISYYEKVQAAVGGYANLQSFDRMFLIPGMAHCAGAADVNGVAGPAISSSTLPLPQSGQLYQNLVNWVEKKTAPTSITLTSTDGSNSMPVCMYPTKITYNGTGDVKVASSYSCKL
jgi:feruloyl esterase